MDNIMLIMSLVAQLFFGASMCFVSFEVMNTLLIFKFKSRNDKINHTLAIIFFSLATLAWLLYSVKVVIGHLDLLSGGPYTYEGFVILGDMVMLTVLGGVYMKLHRAIQKGVIVFFRDRNIFAAGHAAGHQLAEEINRLLNDAEEYFAQFRVDSEEV